MSKKEFTVFEPGTTLFLEVEVLLLRLLVHSARFRLKWEIVRSFLENSISLGQYFVLEGSVAFKPLPRLCFLLILLIRVAGFFILLIIPAHSHLLHFCSVLRRRSG